ncbi:MAG: TIM barrel protein, partial [Spirochaetota bacterium]
MIEKSRFCLNRILFPKLKLEDFFSFAVDLGLSKVELRNDLPGIDITDGRSPAEIVKLSKVYGIEIKTINALQKFNLSTRAEELLEKLNSLVGLARAINCQAIVLCPNNDREDHRDRETIYRATVEALKRFSPVFDHSGVSGYVEPLGFEECSLRSKITAIEAIRQAGGRNLRIVHDTFHHRIGPDA